MAKLGLVRLRYVLLVEKELAWCPILMASTGRNSLNCSSSNATSSHFVETSACISKRNEPNSSIATREQSLKLSWQLKPLSRVRYCGKK